MLIPKFQFVCCKENLYKFLTEFCNLPLEPISHYGFFAGDSFLSLDPYVEPYNYYISQNASSSDFILYTSDHYGEKDKEICLFNIDILIKYGLVVLKSNLESNIISLFQSVSLDPYNNDSYISLLYSLGFDEDDLFTLLELTFLEGYDSIHLFIQCCLNPLQPLDSSLHKLNDISKKLYAISNLIETISNDLMYFKNHNLYLSVRPLPYDVKLPCFDDIKRKYPYYSKRQLYFALTKISSEDLPDIDEFDYEVDFDSKLNGHISSIFTLDSEIYIELKISCDDILSYEYGSRVTKYKISQEFKNEIIDYDNLPF